MSEIIANMPIEGSISAEVALTGTLSTSITGDVYEKYNGEYEVSPLSSTAQTLETKNKLLEDDITVLKIQYQETTNTSNGLTAYIGE